MHSTWSAASQNPTILLNQFGKTHGSVPREHIINPPDSSVAIVNGAVMYGINPSIVQERVAARSYGFCKFVNFNSSIHPKSKAEYHNRVKMCKDVYDEFLECGQNVRNSGMPIITRSYFPVEPNQLRMIIKVYSAPKAVHYVDDRGCEHMASIMVEMPDITGGMDRKVFVEIEFDGPEIHVVAKDENTGKCCDVSLDFMYDK